MKNKKQEPKRLKLSLKKGDNVIVIAGKDKGAKGEIINIDRVKAKVVVSGVNIVTKHVKPQGPENPGRIDKFEAPIHYSNVLLFNEKSGKGERIKTEVAKDGSKKRIFAKTGNTAN